MKLMLCAVVMANNSDGVLLPIAASAGKTRSTLFVSSLSLFNHGQTYQTTHDFMTTSSFIPYLIFIADSGTPMVLYTRAPTVYIYPQ